MKLYTLILDRSGSMVNIWDEITNIVNQHIEKKSQDALTSLQLFDSCDFEWVYKYENNSPFLDKNKYLPRDSTPLRDAIMRGVETLSRDWGDLLSQFEVEFTIFTDGQENASTLWTTEDVNRTINHFQTQYGWKFNFIGAGTNTEVTKYAESIGIKKDNVIAYQKSEELAESFARI